MEDLEDMPLERLRELLADRDAEARELQEQLVQAAMFGQELVRQNEALKEELQEHFHSCHGQAPRPAPGPAATSSSAPQSRSRSNSVSSNSIGADSQALLGLRRVHFGAKQRGPSPGDHSAMSDTESHSGAASVKLGRRRNRHGRTTTTAWEQFLRDRHDTEEECVRLQLKIHALEEELDKRRRGSFDHSDARSMMSNLRSVSQESHRVTPMAVSKPGAGDDSEEEAMRDRILTELESKFQDRIDELEIKYHESETLVRALQAELREHAMHLTQEKARYTQLWRANEENRLDLSQAHQKIREQGEVIELERQQRSMSRIRSTIRSHSGAFSMVQHQNTLMSAMTLRDEVTDRDVESLEEENAELLDEVHTLRNQLSHAEDQLAHAESHQRRLEQLCACAAGGADAGGGVAEGAAVETLRSEVVVAQRERDEAIAAAKRLQLLMAPVEVTATAGASRRADEHSISALGVWDRLFNATQGITCHVVCCRGDRPRDAAWEAAAARQAAVAEYLARTGAPALKEK